MGEGSVKLQSDTMPAATLRALISLQSDCNLTFLLFLMIVTSVWVAYCYNVDGQNSNTSLLFWNLFTGLKFPSELNIKSSLSQNSQTTQPSYPYDLVSIQPPHGHNTRSSPYDTLIKPSSSLDPSDMLHLIYGTSFLHHSEFLIIHAPLSYLHLNMPV